MFNHASYKMKISAYVFFIVSVLRMCYREIKVFIELGSPNSILMETIFSIVNSIVMYFVISLFIYAIGHVFERFEKLKDDKIVSKLEN